ncbi:MAG: glycosyltransferase family 2 protein [candidate division FCPU426 bacterium]
MTRPLVSVIVPFYNEAPHLEACFKSLFFQRFKGFELIAVDDGSNDGSSEIAERFLREHPSRMRLFKSPHLGVGAARNLAAKKALGKILVFVDADMQADPGFVGKIIAPIRSGKEDGTFVVDELVSNLDNAWAKAWNLQQGVPLGRRLPLDMPSRCDLFRAISRKAYLKAGGNREKLGANSDVIRSRDLKPALAVPGAILYHANPHSMTDVMLSARWYGRGEAAAKQGSAYARLLWAYNPLKSVLGATLGALRHGSPFFFVFRIVFDAAHLWGLLEGRMTGKTQR